MGGFISSEVRRSQADLAAVERKRREMERKRKEAEDALEEERLARLERQKAAAEIKLEAQRIALENLEAKMDAAVDKERARALDEANFIARTSEMVQQFRDDAAEIVDDYKKGIGTEDGKGKFIQIKEAIEIAKQRFTDEHVKECVASKREECDKKIEAHVAAVKAKADAEALDKRATEDACILKQKRERELKTLEYAQRREKIRDGMQIVGFERCTVPCKRCLHKKVRHWGTHYKKGIRCRECGVEIEAIERYVASFGDG